jgi:hypothetical protein
LNLVQKSISEKINDKKKGKSNMHEGNQAEIDHEKEK